MAPTSRMKAAIRYATTDGLLSSWFFMPAHIAKALVARNELESTGQIAQLDRTIGSQGYVVRPLPSWVEFPIDDAGGLSPLALALFYCG